ncbi:ABC transporter permease, partial [Parabacteroides sp. OttesenSCG-928-G06]|nr:ABC transporter permease [Parabacteroides sp. OttesenSCG-928-G06]
MGLKYLLEKEFKQLLRNKFMVGVAVMFPLAVLLIMPWATNLDIKNIQVTLIDNDMSPLSRDFIRQIEHSTYFNVYSQTGTYKEALADLEKWHADLILEIPAGFEQDLVHFGRVPLQITLNTVNSIKGVMGQSYMSELMMQYSRTLAETGKASSPMASPKVEIITRNMYNPTLNYRFTMIPGLIMITLIILGGFLPAVNIVVEKEMGTIEQLNVT